MVINGIGIISSVGRGLEAHRRALTEMLPGPSDGFCRVAESILKDPVLARDARRADRFDRMAVLAGMDALDDAGLSAGDRASTGLILATAQGPHVTTFRFLDDLINFKEKDVSPTLFSHSVHNAAASYLSLLAGIRGPTTTVTAFGSAFYEALGLAQCWLTQQRCSRVLVGAVDELGTVMEEILKSRIASIDGDVFPMTEGAVFFVVSAEPSRQYYGSLGGEYAARSMSKGRVRGGSSWGDHPCQGAFQAAVTALKSARSKGGE